MRNTDAEKISAMIEDYSTLQQCNQIIGELKNSSELLAEVSREIGASCTTLAPSLDRLDTVNQEMAKNLQFLSVAMTRLSGITGDIMEALPQMKLSVPAESKAELKQIGTEMAETTANAIKLEIREALRDEGSSLKQLLCDVRKHTCGIRLSYRSFYCLFATFLVLVAFFAATVLINYQFLRFPILSTAIEGAILLTALIIALICYFIN